MTDGSIEYREANLDEFPSTIAMPRYPMPTIFNGGSPADDYEYVQIFSWTKRNEFLKSHPGTQSVRANIGIDALIFARFLAKIAHSILCAQKQEGTFEPLLSDIILGKSDKVAYFIGGEFFLSDHETDNGIDVCTRVKSNHLGTVFFVKIRMFKALGLPGVNRSGAPVYWVAAARL